MAGSSLINRIVFVQREMEDKLGVMILTAYLKSRGFDARIIVDPLREIDFIVKFNPAFIAVSLCSPSLEWSLFALGRLKNKIPGALTVMGGPHPTYFPEVINQEQVDIVCRGEGEKPLLELLQKYNGKISSIEGIPNLWVKNGQEIVKNPLAPLLTQEELSALPAADRAHYSKYRALRNNPHKKIWTSRGCHCSCSYCFNFAYNQMYGEKEVTVRRRSVEGAISELKALKKYGWKCLEITDDQFLFSKDWVLRFCEQYRREIGLAFTCSSSANFIQKDIVKALKTAGCKIIYFGVESGVESIRMKIYNKPVSNKDIYAAAEVLRAQSMPFLTFNIIGLPDEGLSDIYETIRINQQIQTTHPWCSILQPYPGTRIQQYLKDQGSVEELPRFSYSYFQTSPVKDPGKRRLFFNAQKLFAYLVKNKSSYGHFKRLVENPPAYLQKVYPLVFYWHYGVDLRRRYGLSWPALFRYWSYAREKGIPCGVDGNSRVDIEKSYL